MRTDTRNERKRLILPTNRGQPAHQVTMRAPPPKDGYEFRGFKIRLYPDAETETKLIALSDDLRTVWNWLVKQTEDTLAANRAYAVRAGLVEVSPSRPDYDGLPPTEAHKAKKKFHENLTAWGHETYKATKTKLECAFRSLKELLGHFGCKNDYQLFQKVLRWKYAGREEARVVHCGAHLLQALCKNYFTKAVRRKTFKRKQDHVPIQVRSGKCFRLGDFGARRGTSFYNCQITINGLRIRGRLPGVNPSGRLLEGVAVTREADGWYAAIKQEVPIRVPPPARPNTCIGLDVGLDNIVAFSDAVIIENPRGRLFADQIAKRQAAKLAVGRLHQKAKRHIRHVIFNAVVKHVEEYETIKIEDLSSRIGQMGSAKTSVMRFLRTILIQRFGDRVREVDCAYTSQDCSCCGVRSKESWSYANGPIGTCPSCGFVCHRDINAACNVAARPVSTVCGPIPATK